MIVRTTHLTRLAAALALAGVLSACGNKDPQQYIGAAREHLQKNDNAAAIIELKNALQANADLPEARLLLGKAMLDSGDLVGAETELRKAREVNYRPDEVSPLLARAWLGQGQADKVTQAFDQTTLEPPQAQADLLTTLAMAWRAQGKDDLFRKRLEAALKLQPEYAPALIEQARMQASDRDFAAALNGLNQLIAREPGNAHALKLKGDVLLHGVGQTDEAMAAYRTAIAAKPGEIEAHVALVRVLLSKSDNPGATEALAPLVKIAPSHPATLYLQAQLAVQQQDFKLAKERVQQLLKRTPDSPTANELAGVIELQGGSVQQAQAFLAKALQALPELRVARRALVSAHLRAGQVDQAIAALPADFSPEKTNADGALLSLAGRAYMAKGDFALAQAYFKQAAAADPQDPAKRTSLAFSEFKLGKGELALNQLSDIAAQDKGIVADMALINALMQRRDFDKALVAIESLEKKRTNDPMPLHLKGLTLMLKGDKASARAALEAALKADPQYLAAVAGLATLDLADKQPAAALKRLEDLTQKAPQNPQAWLALADVRQSTGASRAEVVQAVEKAVAAAPTEARARVMLVDYLLRQQDEKAALTAAQSAAATLPENAEVLASLGRAQAANGEHNSAVSTFSKVAALSPSSPTPYMLMAGAQAAGKDLKGAQQSLGKALELQPNFLPAQLALAELAMRDRQFDRALEVSQSVQKQRPDQGVGFVMEGDVRAASRAWEPAADAYRKAIKLQASPDVAVKLHAALTAGGKQAEAERWVAEWNKAHPKDVAISMYLGDRAISLSQYPEAIKHYERVLGLQPANALALNNLAWVAGKTGRADAVTLAERAVAAAPDQPAYKDTLAMLYSSGGQHGKAVELQQQALQLKPDVPLYKLNMAKIRLAAGDKAAARTLLDELAAMGDKFAGQAEVARLRSEAR